MHHLRLVRVLIVAALAFALMLAGGENKVHATEHARSNESTVAPPDSSEMAAPVEAGTPPQRAPEPVATVPTSDDGVPFTEPANIPPPTITDIGDRAVAGLSAADLATLEKLRDLINNKRIERIVERRREREAVAAFYAARQFRPLWIENGKANKHAVAAVTQLKGADADGLDPADYATQDFRAAAGPGALAEAELRLTAAVLTYARHAQSGRVHFSRIHSDISYNLAIPEPAEVLSNLAKAENVAEALARYNPPHAGYKALRAKLAELRAAAKVDEIVHVSEGPILHFGITDLRVPILRKRLRISGDQTNATYDEAVVEAVKRFQASAGISPDGVAGPRTLRAINEPRPGRAIDVIIANMERWRWMPRDLGKSYSMLNIADFSLKVARDGVTIWQTKVVVGKRSTPTPILSDTIKFITVNPTWNVPPTIMNNEYLPALRQDSSVLDRMGIKVVRNQDGSVRMYQPPGDKNALGRLRFNFPNKFLVYQHDTPDKNLFDKVVRAYSNGCMRIQDPPKYAEVLLSIALPGAGYTQERLRAMYRGTERNIDLPNPIPVHLTYQTAFVDDSGKLAIRDDIYHHDERFWSVFKGGDRQLADIAVPNAHRHTADPGPSGPRLIGSRRGAHETSEAPSFFERFLR